MLRSEPVTRGWVVKLTNQPPVSQEDLTLQLFPRFCFYPSSVCWLNCSSSALFAFAIHGGRTNARWWSDQPVVPSTCAQLAFVCAALGTLKVDCQEVRIGSILLLGSLCCGDWMGCSKTVHRPALPKACQSPPNSSQPCCCSWFGQLLRRHPFQNLASIDRDFFQNPNYLNYARNNHAQGSGGLACVWSKEDCCKTQQLQGTLVQMDRLLWVINQGRWSSLMGGFHKIEDIGFPWKGR